MLINTTRFGSVELLPEDILLFPAGLFGFEDALHWVLLGDAENESLAWQLRHPTRLALFMRHRAQPVT